MIRELWTSAALRVGGGNRDITYSQGLDTVILSSYAGEGLPVLRSHILVMPGLIQRTAEAIDEMWQSIWGNATRGERIVIAIFLIVTGLAIPVVPIVYLARFIAN